MQREGFIFYQSFRNATKHLPNDNQKNALVMIVQYGIDGIEPDPQTDPVAYAMFLMAKPQLDANNKRHENGSKGGRPKKEETRQKPNNNQNETKTEPKEKEKEKEKENIPPNPQGEDISKKQELIEFAEKRSSVSLGGLSPLPKVEKINDKLYDAWITKRKSYTPDEIKKGANNYVMHIVEGKKKNPENTYFDHRFTLLEFLKQGNGLDKFINLSPNK